MIALAAGRAVYWFNQSINQSINQLINQVVQHFTANADDFADDERHFTLCHYGTLGLL